VGVALVVALVAGVLVLRNRDNGTSPAATKGGVVNEAPAAAPVGGAYDPQPERRFVRVGTNTKQQFSDDQYRFLADNFGVVLFTKFHAGYDITKQHEAARQLVSMKPGISVYPYFSTKYWFEQNKWDGDTINPAWLLRDNGGQLIKRTEDRAGKGKGKVNGKGKDVSEFVDLANPDYRAWALKVLARWLNAAPYAGISFDAADPIGDFGNDTEQWTKLLGKDRIDAYNAGLRDLLASAQKLAGPDRKVLFNGISPSTLRGPERDLDLLDVTSGAMDERFCLSAHQDVQAITDDIGLMTSEAQKQLYMRTNYKKSFNAGQRSQFERFCLGSFLMGWQPGSSFFQIGTDYTADQLKAQDPDVDVNLGHPTAPYEQRGDILKRSFANGLVYVNLGSKATPVQLDAPYVEVRGGQVIGTHKAGDTVSVPSEDAVYLLHPGVADSPSAA